MKCRMPNAECRMPRRLGRRGGFSFTEILFAVMILGIGFIMVAAMFPVAIRQTEAGSQETIAAAIGRTSSNFMQQLAGMPLPPVTSVGVTPIPSRQAPSILLPTFPVATMTAMQTNAGGYVLPPGQNTMVVPGQVWTMCDARDQYLYAYSGVTPSFPTAHNLLLWQSVGKNMIEPSDPRFAWVMMYRRDLIVQAGSPTNSYIPAPFAQIICIGVQCRNTQFYNPATDIPPNPIAPGPPQRPLTPSPLLPWLVGNCAANQGVTFAASASGVSYIDFSAAANATPASMPALAENAYVVICDDNIPPGAKVTTPGPYQNQYLHGMLNGRVFRLGGPGAVASPWPMLPGSDLTASDIALINAMALLGGGKPPQFNVLVVGRPPVGGGFAGPAQDVTAYTTFIPISN